MIRSAGMDRSDQVAGDIAGRIVLVVDAGAPDAARAACDEAAATIAQRTGMPVTLAVVPLGTLDTLQPVLRRPPGRLREIDPPSPPDAAMASAPFVWRRDGRPDWGAMWTTFCELALYGGPPQRGAESALRGPDRAGGPIGRPLLAELQRGILETTGLAAEAAGPGWIAVVCESRRMAAWLCAAIIVENVDARVEDDRLLLPAGPDFVLEDQVRSVITVVAKTHHYWREHLGPSRR
jgi:sirohydrochlorin cobaltochelatase